MNNNIILDIERTNTLVEICGEQNWTTSGYKYKTNNETGVTEILPTNISHAFTHSEVAPVITLDDMLNNICPEFIVDDVDCFLDIVPMYCEAEDGGKEKMWFISYISKESGCDCKSFIGRKLIDAAYDALIWLSSVEA